MKKFTLKNTYLIYTCLFVILLPFVFYPFILKEKSFVWYVDGLGQHVQVLGYYGELLKGILSGKGFPMVDLKLGLGFDTISTIHYYALGDPLTLLSVFIHEDSLVFVYNLLVLIRFYLIGISFICFARYWKKDGHGVILGALIYVFCGFSFLIGIRHPYFLNPMIYLPLLIMGAEEILRRRKPYLMVIMVFISAISNFYFFFDLTIILIAYIIYRYFYQYRKSYENVMLGLLNTGLRTGGYYLLGLFMSAFILLPVIYAFSQNGRLDIGPKLLSGLFTYNRRYYISFFLGLLAPGVSVGSWTYLSYSSVIVVNLVILICDKKYRQLRYAFLFTLAGLFIPAFGYFMNGFAYGANRWCFFMSFMIAFIFTMTYDKFFDLDKKEKTLLFVWVILYGVIAYAFSTRRVNKAVAIVLCLLFILIITLDLPYVRNLKWIMRWKGLKTALLYGLVLASLICNGNIYYSPDVYNYVSRFLTSDAVNKLTSQGVLTLIPEIEDDSIYRIDSYGDKSYNEALTVGYNDVSAYYSLMDANVTSSLNKLQVLSQRAAYCFNDFDHRTILNTLASVKYFATTDKTAAPYGYNLIKETVKDEKANYLFENENALPLGYVYDRYLLKEEYDKLSALKKQNAMLDAIILDEATEYGQLSTTDYGLSIDKLKVKILPDENIVLSKNRIYVKKAGAKLFLEFSSKPNSETYVKFDNLIYMKKANASSNIYVMGDAGPKKSFVVKTKYYNSYYGKKDYLANIGYSSTGKTQAVITFTSKAKYSYKGIYVYSVDMNNYAEQVKNLKSSSLENIIQKNNKIEGDITLSKEGIMALSIPYSKGWCAYVDGKEAKLLKGNLMYMALPLDRGSHHILLKYETPYLRIGCLVSLTALITFIGIAIKRERNRETLPSMICN